MRCQRCDWGYPDGFVNQIKVSKKPHPMNEKFVCAICALDLYNETHGTDYAQWPAGIMANAQLEMCKDIRAGATLSNQPRRATRK